MIFEFTENWSELDTIAKEVILEEYEDSLREEEHSKENIRITIEMVKYELYDIE